MPFSTSTAGTEMPVNKPWGTKNQPWWVWTIERLGFPIFVSCAIGWAAWQIFVWSGENVGKPLVIQHVKTLDAIIETQQQNAQTMRQQADTMQQQSATLTAVRDVVEDVAKTQKSIDTSLQRILEASQ